MIMNTFQYEWLFRIFASVFFATLIGYERHRSYKEAGVRTHVLVALSTCLMMIISKYGFFRYGKDRRFAYCGRRRIRYLFSGCRHHL